MVGGLSGAPGDSLSSDWMQVAINATSLRHTHTEQVQGSWVVAALTRLLSLEHRNGLWSSFGVKKIILQLFSVFVELL